MAQALAHSVVLPVAASSRATLQRPAARSASFKARTVSNGCKVRAFHVWKPDNNKFFETFSYLPPLSDDAIAKQVDYMVNNGFVPCLEFAAADKAYATTEMTMLGNSGYYDNRYWTMWKLPLFGCTDPSQVLGEINACTKAFPESYIRIVAFDSVRQVQCAGFLVHRPDLGDHDDHQAPEERSILVE